MHALKTFAIVAQIFQKKLKKNFLMSSRLNFISLLYSSNVTNINCCLKAGKHY